MAENEHRAAHAVTAEVADEAKAVAEEAKEAAEQAQETAHDALEQSAAAVTTPAEEVEPEAKEEKATEEKVDHSAEILEKLSGIHSRLDDHEARIAAATAPKEEPANDVIEVETEPEPKKEEPVKKTAPKKESDDTGKGDEKNDQHGKAASSRHRFGRKRS